MTTLEIIGIVVACIGGGLLGVLLAFAQYIDAHRKEGTPTFWEKDKP